MRWIGNFEVKCFNNGQLKWDDAFHNALVDGGEQNILDTYLRNSNAPTNFYIGLTNMAGLVESTPLSSLTDEPTGNGYGRIQVTRNNTGWPSLALDAGDYMATSRVVTFEATGTWITVDKIFMATSNDNTGVLISYGALSVPRTLIINDILDITYKIKLQ